MVGTLQPGSTSGIFPVLYKDSACGLLPSRVEQKPHQSTTCSCLGLIKGRSITVGLLSIRVEQKPSKQRFSCEPLPTVDEQVEIRWYKAKLAALLASFILRKPLEKPPFEKAAIKMLESISELEHFITKHRKDYVDLHRITEQERTTLNMNGGWADLSLPGGRESPVGFTTEVRGSVKRPQPSADREPRAPIESLAGSPPSQIGTSVASPTAQPSPLNVVA
ncbi:hypothetical protein ZIOFF_031401 [Zingiber officinale]|uniref:SNARE-complex protein Syntaxin-18 N-terminal domain-containing protein n=1 Tax=Zingiber officinale TaxID=94328 RepID=A0A8J5GHI6_ZINOF|nr:hypothetical protein ZIOFF_031401 [Zingiber officinale]